MAVGMMACMSRRINQQFACQACGFTALQWTGRCDGCGAWNSLAKVAPADPRRVLAPLVSVAPKTSVDESPSGASMLPIGAIVRDDGAPRRVGISEFDRVLGGGLTPGSSTLLSGLPGIGKSTLLLQVAAGLAASESSVVYVAAEEAPTQLRRRAERLGTLPDTLRVTPETEIGALESLIADDPPDVMIIDSIQTVFDAQIAAGCGSIAQVRECTQRLANMARQASMIVVMVGHVTKDGVIAGPRVLEHLVDTVLHFSGDRQHGLRFLRADKHRFGTTDEVGIFTMTATGLVGVADAGQMFLQDRRTDVSGSVVVPLLDGVRPMLTEVQALVVAMPKGVSRAPARSTQGIDRSRLDVLLAVMQQRGNMSAAESDVFISLAGGVRSNEPGLDLGVVIAVVSALMNLAVPSDLVVVGELGLAGEVRQVRSIERRLAEAARHGFSQAIVPSSISRDLVIDGLQLLRVASITEATCTALLPPDLCAQVLAEAKEMKAHARVQAQEGALTSISPVATTLSTTEVLASTDVA